MVESHAETHTCKLTELRVRSPDSHKPVTVCDAQREDRSTEDVGPTGKLFAR